MKLTEEQINQISQELDSGLKCYINIETGEMKSILDWEEVHADPEFWEDELKEIEDNWKEYVILEKMSSREAFEVMESFIDTLSDGENRNRLIHALNGRRPFSNFKNQVDYNDEIRQQWFAHKAEEYKAFTRKQFEDELRFRSNENSELEEE